MKSSANPLSTEKRWVFTLIMLLIPWLILGLIEGSLRLIGYGASYPLFIPVPGHPEYLYQNPEVARRYFGYQRSVPNSNVDVFKRKKSEKTYRIFVQGGSSAAGYPFYHGGAFSRMLEQRLQQTFPDREIEVVNTAMAAVNSYTLLDLADEIIAQQPDAILIYAGHNEFYGALGVGSAESLGKWRPLVLLYLKLRKLYLVQAIRSLIINLRRALHPPGRPGNTLMERMVQEKSIPYGSSLYRQGLQQFQANLHALLSKYAQHNIPVFIATLASNEKDQPPFDGYPVLTNQRQTYLSYLKKARETTNDSLAILALNQAIAQHPIAAQAYFERGKKWEAQANYTQARNDFLQAKDRDLLRFRAPEAFNEIIRDEAQEHNAYLVPLQTYLRAHAPHQLLGKELFLEHLHPNIQGYFLLSDAFYHALKQQHLIGEWKHTVPASEARKQLLITAVDSIQGLLRISKLTSGWPFKRTQQTPSDSLDLSTPEARIALKLYRGEIQWITALETLRHYYKSQGNLREALRTTLALIQEYPFLPELYLAAGNLLIQARQYDEALPYFEAAHDLHPSAYALQMIGAIWLHKNTLDSAYYYLKQALTLDPKNTQALYNLSGVYLKRGQPDSARVLLTRLLALQPDHADARRLIQLLKQ